MNLTRRLFFKIAALCCWWRGSSPVAAGEAPADSARPFGAEFPNLDSFAVGQWGNKPKPKTPNPPPMDVPREQVIAFALYTHDRGVLKITAQLYRSLTRVSLEAIAEQIAAGQRRLRL